MSKYEYGVLGNLDHDQVRYEHGDTVVMGEGEAEPLIALGILLSKPFREIPDEPAEADPDGKAKGGKSAKTPEAGSEGAQA